MHITSFALVFASLSFALPAPSNIQPRDNDNDNTTTCAAHSIGSICQPVNDSPKSPIGDHINLSLVATGIRNVTTGISVALRNPRTRKVTQLSWNQRDANGIENGNQYFNILTSHNGGIFYGPLNDNAYAGEGQLPCSLFDDQPGGEQRFEWLVTHYVGKTCSYNDTAGCYPLIINVPPFERPRTILLKDNADVCGR